MKNKFLSFAIVLCIMLGMMVMPVGAEYIDASTIAVDGNGVTDTTSSTTTDTAIIDVSDYDGEHSGAIIHWENEPHTTDISIPETHEVSPVSDDGEVTVHEPTHTPHGTGDTHTTTETIPETIKDTATETVTDTTNGTTATTTETIAEIDTVTETVEETYDRYGTCGKELSWAFGDYVLVVDGTGKMENYGMQAIDEDGDPYITTAPWHVFTPMITTVLIGGDVERIGSYAFADCVNITDVYYEGDEDDWNNYIEIRNGNENLTNANIHFNADFRIQQLPEPTNLRWNENEYGEWFKGIMSWDSVENCEGVYYITVYRDGNPVYDTTWEGLYGIDRVSVDVFQEGIFNQSGDYTFSVVAVGDGDEYSDSDAAMSDVYHFTAPDRKIGIPTELQWAGNGILRHKAVANASGYIYKLYVLLPNQDTYLARWKWEYDYVPEENTTGYEEMNLTDEMIKIASDWAIIKGVYATVTALTCDIDQYRNGDESEFSALYDIETGKTVAESSMNSVLDSMDNGMITATQALDSFLEQMNDSNIASTDIAVSMQQSEQVINNIIRLEEAYREETGIDVSVGNDEEDNEYLETRGIDVNKITIVGAALNSQGGADVNINFSKVEEMPQVSESFYKNSVAVNIGIDGVKDAENLDIPIQIKMPVPTGVLPDRLVIIHYHADGTSEEIHPAVSYDTEENAYVTFVLTSFSTFVFCNENEPVPVYYSSGGGGTSSYTVKFDTNGGDELKNITVKQGQAIGTIPAPAKKGYVFDGWYKDKELTNPYSADEKVTASLSLYADWKVDPARQLTLTIGDKNATVFGEETQNDVAPIIKNDRTMLPIRFIAEALGAEVTWDAESRTVTITNGETVIQIVIDKNTATVNGAETELDSPAFIENDRTFLPLRFVSENLGAEVEWLEESRQVVITKQAE